MLLTQQTMAVGYGTMNMLTLNMCLANAWIMHEQYCINMACQHGIWSKVSYCQFDRLSVWQYNSSLCYWYGTYYNNSFKWICSAGHVLNIIVFHMSKKESLETVESAEKYWTTAPGQAKHVNIWLTRPLSHTNQTIWQGRILSWWAEMGNYYQVWWTMSRWQGKCTSWLAKVCQPFEHMMHISLHLVKWKWQKGLF